MGLKSAQHCCKASAILCSAPALSVLLTSPELHERWGGTGKAQRSCCFIAGTGCRAVTERKKNLSSWVLFPYGGVSEPSHVTNKLHCAKGWTELLRKNRRAVLAYFCDSIRHTLSEPHCSSVSKPWHGQSEWLGWTAPLPREGVCIFSTQLVVFREVCRCFVLSWKTKGFAPSQEGKIIALGKPMSCSKLSMGCEGEYSSPEPAGCSLPLLGAVVFHANRVNEA